MAYGWIICKGCGIEDIRCLTLDHVNNDGAAERKELFGNARQAGHQTYRYLRKKDFRTSIVNIKRAEYEDAS